MFTFALAFFVGHRYFSFNLFSAFRGKRKEKEKRKEKGIWKKTFTTKTTDHKYCMCQALSVKLIALLALQHTFHLFRKKMHFKVSKKTYEL